MSFSSSLPFPIENQVAFVTGTNKPNGLGRAMVHALLQQGAQKVYATARDASELQDLVTQYNTRVVAVELDVTDLSAIAALSTLYPDVTVLVNNAGYLSGNGAMDNDLEKLQREINVNLIAPWAMVQSFGALWKRSNSSRDTSSTAVVNINSIASLISFPVAGTYSAVKAASHSMTQAQRRELPNSLVVGVYPGPIDTSMTKEVPFEKAPPSSVAKAILQGLQEGQEDIFPDAVAKDLYAKWQKDAKAVEQSMAQSSQ